MALYLHDGAVGGQAAWTEAALTAGVADGAILSPFFTPLASIFHRPGVGRGDGLRITVGL